MAEVGNREELSGNIIYKVNIKPEEDFTLSTRNTYVDKNIIFNVSLDSVITNEAIDTLFEDEIKNEENSI